MLDACPRSLLSAKGCLCHRHAPADAAASAPVAAAADIVAQQGRRKRQGGREGGCGARRVKVNDDLCCRSRSTVVCLWEKSGCYLAGQLCGTAAGIEKPLLSDVIGCGRSRARSEAWPPGPQPSRVHA